MTIKETAAMRFSSGFAVILVAGLLGGCDGRSGLTPSSTPSYPSATQLLMTGLPAPLLFDIPSSLKAGQSYVLGATAVLSDGAVVAVKPTATAWTSNKTEIASFDGNTLKAHRDGEIVITLRIVSGNLSVSRDLTVRPPVETIRQERAERVQCGTPMVCRYPYCPGVGPFWLFPVHESGTIELLDVRNPGWGSPSNYVTQLSAKGEYIRSWLLLKNESHRTATVPGGFMYAFTMGANLGPCGDVSASWIHPG